LIENAQPTHLTKFQILFIRVDPRLTPSPVNDNLKIVGL